MAASGGRKRRGASGAEPGRTLRPHPRQYFSETFADAGEIRGPARCERRRRGAFGPAGARCSRRFVELGGAGLCAGQPPRHRRLGQPVAATRGRGAEAPRLIRHQSDGKTESFCCGMDFRSQSAARPARPWASGPLFPCARQRRADVLVQLCCRSLPIRDQLRAPEQQASNPARSFQSICNTAALRCGSCPAALANRASTNPTAPSTKERPKTFGCRREGRASLGSARHKSFDAFPLVSRSASQSIADLQNSAFNLICAPLGIPVP